MAAVQYAPKIFRALNGAFCIFKPPGVSMKGVRSGLQERLANDLNHMECRPLNERIQYHPENLDTNLPTVTALPDLADSPLVVGARYIPSDIEMHQASFLEHFVSGVMVMGLSDRGEHIVRKLEAQRPLRVYHVSGVLGQATDNYMSSGRLLERSTYYHVSHHKMDRILASMQANHSRRLWNTAALDIQSDEAYQLACKGPLRPATADTEPYIYGVKCIHFKSPNFILEVHVINETGPFLLEMIHDIGLQLKTNATCTQARRIRFGDFTLSHALLREHWYSAHIVENMKLCAPLCRAVIKKKRGRLHTGALEKSKVKEETKALTEGTDTKALTEGTDTKALTEGTDTKALTEGTDTKGLTKMTDTKREERQENSL